ncbi:MULTISPECIES: DUF1266 domain-containing protein [Vibrio]|uniref:DUF1266 domain-containing protein n=2 Tax=Vibrio TaxID=662 RepID=A0A7X4LPE4_9VIBR|nr:MULTISPECIES: DUF1266 domain-containing protein [Vibrio]MBF9003598.1 DUF1266 domain-containing protein [Vibrio nitrifigilis]MZI95730.1 DUF1266 domain-containing protein [Vibrio eleionomae]
MSTTIFNKDLPHCQFWLATTVPQMLYCRRWADYDLIGMKRDDDNLESDESFKAGFINSWGIDTREDWHEMIHRLATGEVHGDVWQHLFSRRATSTPMQWSTLIENHSDDPVFQGELRYVDIVYRKVGHQGFLAWDYVRGTFLTRAGFQVGVVTAEECAFLLNYFSHLMQRHFSNWHQYLYSFILGRGFWVYNKAEAEEREQQITTLLDEGLGHTFDEYFAYLHNDKDVPIDHIDWNTELPDLAVPQSLQQVLENIEQIKQQSTAEESEQEDQA